MGIEINGIAQLMKKLNKISSTATKEAVMSGIEKGCLRVERDAKINLTKNDSVISGILRASITHKLDPSTLSATVGSNVEYAPYVELGTQYQGAKPYLYPALRDNRDNIKQDVANALQQAIRRL